MLKNIFRFWHPKNPQIFMEAGPKVVQDKPALVELYARHGLLAPKCEARTDASEEKHYADR